MSKIAVLGPGGVGGFIAATLARAGQEVTVVARPATAATIGAQGIDVTSAVLGSFQARPLAVSQLDTVVDFLLVTTKASGLEPALSRIEADPGLVVPLLNGLEHIATLRCRFGAQRVAAGVIRIESDHPAPGRIVQTSPSIRIDLADEVPGQATRVRRLAELIEAAGVAAQVGPSERQILWSKLARLNALALTTSASDRPLGFVRTDPRWRSALQGAIGETVQVANADGAALRADATLAELAQAPAELGSSMRRDIAAGREPELDAIAGAVLRAGARHAIGCPTVTWLAERVAQRAGIPAPAWSV
jgi:2-dehydropantoate 2-reductase